ncbi:MAG: histidine kinase [Alphaproteobacteria bacterium]
MTHFLSTDENPDGYKLEDILSIIRQDIIKRAGKIAGDARPEARRVVANNMRILEKLTDCIELAEDSTDVLNRSFGSPGK